MSTVQLSTNLSGGLYNYYIGPCPGPLVPYVGNPTTENPITVNLLNYGWTSGDYCYKICGAIPPSFTDGCCCSDTGTGECCDKWSLYTTQTGGCTYTVLDCDNNLYELLVAPFNNEIICAKNVTYTCNNSNADVVEECDCSIVTTRYSVVDCCNDPSNTIIIKVTDSDQLPSLPFTINNYFIDGNINNRRCLKFVEEISGEVTPDFTYTATEVLSAIVDNEGCPPSGSTTTVTIPQGGSVTICSVTNILSYTEGFVEITTEEACDGISAEFCTSYTLQGLPGQTITYAPCEGVESTCTDCNNNLYYSAQNCCGGDTIYFEIIQDIDFTLPDTPFIFADDVQSNPWINNDSNCWTITSQVQEPPIEIAGTIPMSYLSTHIGPEGTECNDTIATSITNLANNIEGAQVIDVIDGDDIYNFTVCVVNGSLSLTGSFGSQIDVENFIAVIVSERACGGTTSEFCTSYNINSPSSIVFTYTPCYYGSDTLCHGCLPTEGSFHIFCNCEETSDTPIPYQYDVSEPYSPYPICSGMTFTNTHPTETITITSIGAEYGNCLTSSLYNPGYLTIQPGDTVTQCTPYTTFAVLNSTPNGTGTIEDINIVNNGDGECDNQYFNVPLQVYDVCDLLPLMTSGLTESGDIKYSAPELVIINMLVNFYFGYDTTLIPWLDQDNSGSITTSDLLLLLGPYTVNGEIVLPQECYQLSSCNYVIDDGNEYQEGQYYSIYGVDYNGGQALNNPETNCYRYDGMYNGTVDINDILLPQGTNAINQTPFTSCSECTDSTLSVTISGYIVWEGNPGGTTRIQFTPNGSINGSDLNVTLANYILVGTQDGEWTSVFQSVTSGTQFTVQSVQNQTENVVITVDVGQSLGTGDIWRFPILSLDSYTQDEPFIQGESVTLTIS